MNERTEKKWTTVTLSAYGVACLALLALLVFLAVSFYAPSPAKQMGEPKVGITQTQEPKRGLHGNDGEREKIGPLEKRVGQAS